MHLETFSFLKGIASRIRASLLTFAATLGIALIPGLSSVNASDHADSPNTAEGNLDISDLYVFAKGENMVFAMIVNPLLTPGEKTTAAAFNPSGLYQFKLDKERDGKEDAVIQVTFEGSGTTQKVMVRGPSAVLTQGPDKNKLVKTTPVMGGFDKIFSGEGMSVFAGPRDDPFYIHLFGDSSLTSVLNGAYSAALGSLVGEANQQTLAFSENAKDDLRGTNTLAIVIEVPKSKVASSLGLSATGKFYTWATTSMKN